MMFFIPICVVVSIAGSFLFLNRYSTVWICHNLFIYSPVGRHLNCFQLEIINEKDCCEYRATCLCMNVCFHFSWINKSGIAVSIQLYEKLRTVFQSDLTVLHSSQSSRRVLMLRLITNPGDCQSFQWVRNGVPLWF